MVANSAEKMKEAPPLSTQPLQPFRDTIPSSSEGVMKVGVVQSSMAPPPTPPSVPPLLSDSGDIQMFEKGSKNFSLFSDDSLSASRIEVVVDSLTTKKKRKGPDSSLMVVGRYDLGSQALR